jgi:TPR repeat protein
LVGDVDLRELGVRPALVVATHDVLPPYVTRDCDNALRKALRAGGLVVVEGPAWSGRTRTALNAIHTTLAGRKLLTPRTHREIEELVQTGPIAGSVVWLGDAERFDESDLRLIREIYVPQRPDVVVVATAQNGTALSWIPTSTVSVGKELSGNEREAAQRLQDDPRIMAALFGQQTVRLAEDVAAGPLLRDRWRRDSDDLLGAAGKAVVSAALHIYLAGYTDGIPAAVLEKLHRQFLPESIRYNPSIPAFAEELKWACMPVYGFSSLLVAERNNRYRLSRQLAYWLANQPDRPRISDAIWKAVLVLASGRECRGIGLRAYQAKRYDVAERALRRAISESDADDSWVALVSNELGAVLSALSRYEEAEHAFERAAQLGRFPEAMVNLAKTLAERGDEADAERWLRKAAELGDTGAMGDLVGLLAARGDQEAMAWCQIALRAGDAMPTSRLAFYYAEEGDLATAEGLLRQAAHLKDPVIWFNLGQVLNQRRELDEARELYRKAADTGHGASFTALGMLAEDAGDLEEARQHYRHGGAAGDPGAMRQLGMLLLAPDDDNEQDDDQEHLAEAYELLERASDLGDDHATIYLAGLLYHFGRPQAARQRLRRAAEMGSAPAMLLLAEHYQQQGDQERARQWAAAGTSALGNADQVARIRSIFHESLYASAEDDQTLPVQDAEAWVAMARLLISHRGEVTRSERECREAIEAGEDSALVDLAVLLILRGELEEAFAVVQRASDIGDPDGLAMYGSLLMKSGDETAAERLIDQVGDPDHPLVAILKLIMSARRHDEAGIEEWISRVGRPIPKMVRADTHREVLASVQLRLEPGLTLSNVDLAAVWFLDGLTSRTEAGNGAVLTPEQYRGLVDNDMPPLVGQLLDEVITLLAERGLISAGTPTSDLAVTDLGARTVTERRKQLRDPVVRRYACRQAMLLWLYAGEATNSRPLVSPDVHETSLSFIHGDEFTEEEVHNSVLYLQQQGLLTIHSESSLMTISADGSDCVERDQASITKFLESRTMSGQSINNGPVIYGDANGAQLAWNNHGDVAQNRNEVQQIAPGFEPLAQAVADLLKQLPTFGLDANTRQEVEEVADEVLAEVVQTEPEPRKLRRAVAALKGFLMPIVVEAASAEARELAQQGIDQLTAAL